MEGMTFSVVAKLINDMDGSPRSHGNMAFSMIAKHTTSIGTGESTTEA